MGAGLHPRLAIGTARTLLGLGNGSVGEDGFGQGP